MSEESEAPHPAQTPIPGTRPDKQLDFLYVETRAGETPLKHLKLVVGKAYRSALKSGEVSPPKNGLLGTTGWLLEIPTGQTYYGLQFGGDREGWLAALRYCARSAGRSAGQIIGYTRIPAVFVLDDGRRFQLDACKCRKA